MTTLGSANGVICINRVADVIDCRYSVREHDKTPREKDHDNTTASVGTTTVVAAHTLTQQKAFLVHSSFKINDHGLAMAEVRKDFFPFSHVSNGFAGFHGKERCAELMRKKIDFPPECSSNPGFMHMDPVCWYFKGPGQVHSLPENTHT
jgi:hypothetical protein